MGSLCEGARRVGPSFSGLIAELDPMDDQESQDADYHRGLSSESDACEAEEEAEDGGASAEPPHDADEDDRRLPNRQSTRGRGRGRGCARGQRRGGRGRGHGRGGGEKARDAHHDSGGEEGGDDTEGEDNPCNPPNFSEDGMDQVELAGASQDAQKALEIINLQLSDKTKATYK